MLKENLVKRLVLADDAGIDTTIDSPYNVLHTLVSCLDRLIVQVRMRLKQV